jgi:hypothetical protein
MTGWVGGWMRVGRVHTLSRLFASCCAAHSKHWRSTSLLRPDLRRLFESNQPHPIIIIIIIIIIITIIINCSRNIISSIVMRFEMPMVVNTNVTVIWYVTPYSLVNRRRSLEETATFFSTVNVEESQIPWRRKQLAPPKRRQVSTSLHGVKPEDSNVGF